MTLINPIELMTLLGKTPERKYRGMTQQNREASNFGQEMNTALGQTEKNTPIYNLGGSAAENAFLHDAIHGLTSLLRNSQSSSRSGSGHLSGKNDRLGALSAQFESGKQGVNAIGYDKNGGTSYGTYQIASKPGTMKNFLDFLESKAPAWAKELKAAGPANTGSKNGQMPEVWRKIATQSPEKFEALQREFIAATHYTPARDKILAQTGIDMDAMPMAVRETLWSTAVQHGPGGAAKIFNRAVQSLKRDKAGNAFVQQLITRIYDDRPSHFGSSTSQVQASAKTRMKTEKDLVLAMLSSQNQTMA